MLLCTSRPVIIVVNVGYSCYCDDDDEDDDTDRLVDNASSWAGGGGSRPPTAAWPTGLVESSHTVH